MHIISHRAIVEFCRVHPEAESALGGWYKEVRKATWNNFGEVRAMYGSADRVGACVIFNAGGNKYRLITAIHFPGTTPEGRRTEGRVYLLHVLTHIEYDKGAWKADCACE